MASAFPGAREREEEGEREAKTARTRSSVAPPTRDENTRGKACVDRSFVVHPSISRRSLLSDLFPRRVVAVFFIFFLFFSLFFLPLSLSLYLCLSLLLLLLLFLLLVLLLLLFTLLNFLTSLKSSKKERRRNDAGSPVSSFDASGTRKRGTSLERARTS